jgi:hypothetical protein
MHRKHYTLIVIFPCYCAIFLAYGLFSIPAGYGVERFGEKHYSVNLTIVQVIFGGFAYVSPFIYS